MRAKLFLVILTIFLLPQMAWGQEPTVTTSFKGLDDDYSIIYDRDQTTGEWTWTTPWPAYWVPSPSESGGLTFYLDYSESQSFDVAYFTSKFALYGTVKKGDLIATITTNDFLQNGFIIVKGGSSNSTLCELNIFNSHAGTYYLYSEKDSETFNGENIRIDLTRIETSYNMDDFVLKSINLYNLQTTPVTPQFSGGNGTADSPYLIGNATDLKDLSECINSGQLNDKVFQLSADIDCSQLDEFSPIGYKDDNMDYSFKGTFDGNGRTISNLTIEGNYEYAGLFGYVSEGTIENLTLENIIVNNEGAYAGAIAGIVYDPYSNGTIKNTLVKGSSSVTSTDKAGAIIGKYVSMKLENNYYAISVTTETSSGLYSGYDHRGIGSYGDWFENDGAVLYNTYKVTISTIEINGAALLAYVKNRYNSSGNDYLVVGGQEVILEISGTISSEDISVTKTATNETIDITPEDPQDGCTVFSFTMPNEDVTVTLTIGVEKYDLWVGSTRVTERNCSDILGDGNASQTGTGSFQYVPSLKKLFITNNTGNLDIKSEISDSLTIYLAPKSTNAVGNIAYTGNGNAKLIITTDGNYPGVISLSANADVISGFSSLTLEQNLVIMEPEDIDYDAGNRRLAATSATIGVPLSPITKETYIQPNGAEIVPNADESDINKVVDDILYTLGDTEDPEGDGFDDGGYIVINTVTSDHEAAEAAKDYTPGTEDFMEHLKGMTFLVPAGKGKINLDIQTMDDHILKVKIGDAVPNSIEKTERGVVEIPYNVGEPTYVYLYNGGPAAATARSKAIGKGGKKKVTHVRVYTIGVAPAMVKSANSVDEASGGAYTGDFPDLEGQKVMSDEEIEAAMGDVDGDGKQTAKDITEMVKAIMGLHSGVYDDTNADMNEDGEVNIVDIIQVVNKIVVE